MKCLSTEENTEQKLIYWGHQDNYILPLDNFPPDNIIPRTISPGQNSPGRKPLENTALNKICLDNILVGQYPSWDNDSPG